MDFCTNCINEYAWRQTENPFPRECKECEVIDGKPSNFKPKNKTNADSIRAMSDEELAEYIAGIIDDANSGSIIYSNRTEEWLEWLKQPAQE